MSAIILFPFGLVITMFLVVRYAGLRGSSAALAWLAITGTAIGTGLYRHSNLEGLRRMGIETIFRTPDRVAWATVCSALFVFFAGSLAIRLYRKWLDGALTEAERLPGAEGVRAWLSPANLMMAGMISVLGWQGFGWSLLLLLVLTTGALLAWPILHSQKIPTASHLHMDTNDNTSREREKVLSLLESGKITAEESAELLQALAAGSAESRQTAAVGSRSVLGIVGAALVLVGFFLPWYSFSPTAKLASMMQEIDQNMGAPFMEMSKAMPMKMQKVSFGGGDVANGLGWIVLVLALTSALLPHIAPQLDRASLRTFRILSLAGGGIILLYLLTQDLTSVAIGLIVVLVGYCCSGLALWREVQPEVPSARSTEAHV